MNIDSAVKFIDQVTTLPIAMKRRFLGRIMLIILSVYLKISIIISSSVSGAGYENMSIRLVQAF